MRLSSGAELYSAVCSSVYRKKSTAESLFSAVLFYRLDGFCCARQVTVCSQITSLHFVSNIPFEEKYKNIKRYQAERIKCIKEITGGGGKRTQALFRV